MPKPRWTTTAERAWLKGHIPAFIDAQENDKMATVFFPELYAAWAETFPLEPPSTMELEKAGGDLEKAKTIKKKFTETRISQWFHNTTRPLAPNGKQGVIKLQKTAKILLAWQAYQSLYYEEKLKTLVDEAYDQHIKSLPEGTKPKGRLAILGEIARENFKNEMPEVIAEVEKHCAKPKDELEVPSRKAEIELYQSNIDRIPATLAAIVKTLQKETGWSFTVIGGGPSPVHDRKIGTLIMHSGQIPETEVEFDEYMGKKEWNDNILTPWDKFLHEVYPVEVCKEFSLTSQQGTPDPDVMDHVGDSSNKASASFKKKSTGKKQASEYEKQRQENIRKNKELLDELMMMDGGRGYLAEKEEQKKKKRKGKNHDGKNRVEQGGPPKGRGSGNAQSFEGSVSAVDTPADAAQTRTAPTPTTTPATQPNDASTMKIPAEAAQTHTVPTPDTQPNDTSHDTNPKGNVSAMKIPEAAQTHTVPTPATQPDTNPAVSASQASTIALTGSDLDDTADMMDIDKENGQPAGAEDVNDHGQDGNLLLTNKPPTLSPASIPSSAANNINRDINAKEEVHIATPGSVAGIDKLETTTNDSPGTKPIDTVSNVLVPPLLEGYVQESKTYLGEVSDLQIWKNLVEIWVRFETNCPQRGSISTKNRPDQVAWWLKRARKPKVVPTIELPGKFASKWQQWWLAMQPDWRLDDKENNSAWPLTRTAPENPDNAWAKSTLYHAGPIGFHLVVMALAWWGQVIKDQEQQDQFREAVEDVHWVLEQIVNSFGSNMKMKKRLTDDDEPSGDNPNPHSAKRSRRSH